jgi:hypothetical protein
MAGEIKNESAKREEASVRTFSDAGSIPAASTNLASEVRFNEIGTKCAQRLFPRLTGF